MQITCLSLSDDGRYAATGSMDTSVLLWDLLGEAPASGPFAADEPDQLWKALDSAKAREALPAIRRLSVVGGDAVTLLRKHVHAVPVPAVDPKLIERFVDELASPVYDLREKATRELGKLAKTAEPALLKAVQETESVEQRRRAQSLLEKISTLDSDGEQVRPLRGVEVLERIGSAEARAFLRELAAGRAGAPLTRHAVGALERLEQRCTGP